MEHHVLWSVGLVILLVHDAHTLPTGAPNAACSDQFPQHGTDEQSSTPPYELQVDATEYAAGQQITVTIRGTNGAMFKGFFLQARMVLNPSQRAGTFTTDGSGQRLECDEEAITHSNRNLKSSVTVTWTAPDVPVGNIKLRATVVEQYTTFWINVESGAIIDVTADQSLTLPPSTVPIVPTDPPSTDISINLDGCGDTKGCFRTPAGCEINDCDIAATWSHDSSDSYVTFEIQGATDGWIGLGFSDDNNMGSDYVQMCVKVGASAAARSTYNEGRVNTLLDNSTFGLSESTGSYEDGVVKCVVRREIATNSVTRRKRADNDNEKFLPLDNRYRLLLGQGPISGGGAIRKHDKIPLISDEQVRVTTDMVDVGSDPIDYLMYKLHGLFMISAWMLLISISLILARFYKPAFPGKTICGVQVWFALHRAFNIMAVALTIAAFIIIFVKVEGYTEISDDDPTYLKAHPILGIVVTGLAILNPLMALVRPHPDEPSRPVFNWFHWGVGTLAHIGSIVTIFFGFDMPKAQPFIDDADRDWVRYVLGAFCALHFIVYLILDVQKCRTDRNKKDNATHKEMEMTGPSYEATKGTDSTDQLFGAPEQPFTLGYVLLVIYVMGTVGAYAAIVYGIASADTDPEN